MMAHAVFIGLFAWAFSTVAFSVLQAIENHVNGRESPFWAPVWWIALTWPVWLAVIALDVRWAPHFPGRRTRP